MFRFIVFIAQNHKQCLPQRALQAAHLLYYLFFKLGQEKVKTLLESLSLGQTDMR